MQVVDTSVLLAETEDSGSGPSPHFHVTWTNIHSERELARTEGLSILDSSEWAIQVRLVGGRPLACDASEQSHLDCALASLADARVDAMDGPAPIGALATSTSGSGSPRVKQQGHVGVTGRGRSGKAGFETVPVRSFRACRPGAGPPSRVRSGSAGLSRETGIAWYGASP